MKSIIYILITAFIGVMLLSALPKTYAQDSNNILIIQTTDKNYSDIQFAKSEKIIKNRLEGVGIKKFQLDPNNVQGTIKIKFQGTIDLSSIEELVCSSGKLEFCETLHREVALDRLLPDNLLFTMLFIPKTKEAVNSLSSDAVIGFSKGDNRSDVENYLKAKASKGYTIPGVKLTWSKYPLENDSYQLFLLKENAGLSNKDVQEAEVKASDMGTYEILISFKDAASESWKEMTSKNIDKSIAIVVDGFVYAAPLVKSAIDSGKCKISGSFSESEANMLASLINGEAMPLNFEVVR